MKSAKAEILACIQTRKADRIPALSHLTLGVVIDFVIDKALPETNLKSKVGDIERQLETSFILLLKGVEPDIVVRE